MLTRLKEDLQAEIEKQKQRLKDHALTSPLAIPAHVILGKLYERAGDTEAAIEEFATAALAFADQGNIIKAMVAAQMIKRLDPDNDELLARLEELYVLRKTATDKQLQEYQESLRNLEAAVSAPIESAPPEKEAFDETESAAPPDTTLDVVAALRPIPVFAKLSVSELRGLQTHSILRRFAPDQAIIAGGNARRSLFAIIEGTVKVFGLNNDQRESFLGEIPTGSTFGEMALFGKVDASLSVRAGDVCTILEIPRDLFLKLAKMRPYMLDVLKDLYRHRVLESALARVSILRQLTPQDRQKILRYFKPSKAEQGAVLVREGDSSDSLYFVATGEVGVYTSLLGSENEEITISDADRVLLATLSSGDFFGEQALVMDEPSSATIIALKDVVLFTLSRRDLTAIIQQYPWMQSALNVEAFQNERRKKVAAINQAVGAA